MVFELPHERKVHIEQERQYMVWLCLGTIGLILTPLKFDVLKTSIFALKASLLGQILVYKYQISAGNHQPVFFRRKHATF